MRIRSVLAAAAVTLLALTPIRAEAQLATNQWYTFGFGGVGTFAIAGAPGFTLGLNSIAAGDPSSWTYTSVGAFRFLLVDGFNSGDRFELFDGSTSLGLTSAPTLGSDCDNDENACLGNSAMSSRTYELGAGSYAFGVKIAESPFSAGAAFFRIEDAQSVPEPTSFLLLVGGVLGLAGVARRRRA